MKLCGDSLMLATRYWMWLNEIIAGTQQSFTTRFINLSEKQQG
jgi:hypothetical protein